MRLEQLMKLLAVAELSNVSWSDFQEKKIQDEYKEPLKVFIQEALNKLYGHFYLKEDSIYLEPVDGKVVYDITSDHLMDTSLEPDYDHYLWKPGHKPFEDDILKIIRIIDSSGQMLPLNNPEKSNSVFTPLFNRIHLGELNDGLELEIIYAAKHPPLSLEENSIIELPVSLIPAVRAYVAYLVHMNMNTENAVQNAQKYLNQYNLIISENVQSDISFVSKDERNTKFVLGGWV